MDDSKPRIDLMNHVLDLNREIARECQRGLPREWIETDVTMPQFKTLMVLYNLEQATMGELAEALGTGVSTVTGIVDRLVEHGLVGRDEDPRDRRVVVGRPTPRGIALVDRLMNAVRDRVGQVLARLSDEELAEVARSTEILHRAALAAYSPNGRRARHLDPINVGGT
jgi:DNA-binding MarR family transcriptional regulator